MMTGFECPYCGRTVEVLHLLALKVFEDMSDEEWLCYLRVGYRPIAAAWR